MLRKFCGTFDLQNQVVMKKTRLWIACLPMMTFALVLSCSQEEEAQVRIVKGGNEDDNTGQQLPDVKADRLLVVELKGMTCVHGCGGTIRKELYATDAVKEVSFDFDEKKPVDVAKVAYDRDKISADEIISILAEANEGQFTVIKTSSEPYVDASLSNETSDASDLSAKSAGKVAVKTSSYESIGSGIFDIFSWF